MIDRYIDPWIDTSKYRYIYIRYIYTCMYLSYIHSYAIYTQIMHIPAFLRAHTHTHLHQSLLFSGPVSGPEHRPSQVCPPEHPPRRSGPWHCRTEPQLFFFALGFGSAATVWVSIGFGRTGRSTKPACKPDADKGGESRNWLRRRGDVRTGPRNSSQYVTILV